MISHADSDPSRQEVLALFLDGFDEISPNAVPMNHADHLYAPLVVRYEDDESGELVGAALTCRAQVAAITLQAARPLPAQLNYRAVQDKHSELDLMYVAPSHRGQGIASALIEHMEAELRQRGVKVWFGNATRDLDVPHLRAFYAHRGFTVLADGEPLPPLLGKNWVLPGGDDPAFYFYKQLSSAI